MVNNTKKDIVNQIPAAQYKLAKKLQSPVVQFNWVPALSRTLIRLATSLISYSFL